MKFISLGRSGLVCLFICMGISLHSFGQLNIVNARLNPLLVTPGMLSQPLVSVGPAVHRIVIDSELTDSRSGEILISSTSLPLDVRSGINQIQAGDGFFESVRFGGSDLARYIRNQRRLPSGSFEYCVQVRSVDGEFFEDSYCDTHMEVVNEYLRLLSPNNGDTIDHPLPVLNWLTSSIAEMGIGSKTYRLLLTDMRDEEDPEGALNSFPIQYLENDMKSFAIPYPVSAPSLMPLHTYAWRVECLVDGEVVEETESWKFTIKGEQEKESLKYAELRRHLGGETYDVYNGKIYLTFDERYFGVVGQPVCRIYSDNGTLVADGVTYDPDVERAAHQDEIAGSVSETRQGMNKYVFDVSTYNLEEGVYTLQLLNFKGETQKLRFRIIY